MEKELVLVDTSVWIDYFNGRNQEIFRRLGDLINEDRVVVSPPIVIELLSGSGKKDRKILRRILSGPHMAIPSEQIWQLMEMWIEHLGGSDRFGFSDLLIAAIAAENEIPIWSLDQDFRRMMKNGWVRLLY